MRTTFGRAQKHGYNYTIATRRIVIKIISMAEVRRWARPPWASFHLSEPNASCRALDAYKVLWIRIIGNQEHLKPKFSGERVHVSIPTEDVFKDTFNVGTWKDKCLATGMLPLNFDRNN